MSSHQGTNARIERLEAESSSACAKRVQKFGGLLIRILVVEALSQEFSRDRSNHHHVALRERILYFLLDIDLHANVLPEHGFIIG